MAAVTLLRHVARSRPLVLALLLLVPAGGAAGVLLHGRATPVGPPSRPPGLGDLWTGRAAPVLDRKWTSTALGAPAGGAWAGAHVEIVDGTWYLFDRRSYPAACAGHPDVSQAGTQVRASDDRGVTWGPPADILAPRPGTPWACAATDGDAVFDRAAGVWRYLFQCLGDGPGWSGCYAERHGASPLGAFAPPGPDTNPVIANGELWSRICDDPGDACLRSPGQRPIGDEGTFDVFAFDGDGWWVGFHGYDGTRGYRGIARTTTFARGGWQVDGAGGTPRGAVIGAADATGWRESWEPGGPVGPGAASVLDDGGWHYQLAEVPDVDLDCTPGQNWDLGLFRARRVAGRWEQYPGRNPVVYSSRGPEGSTRPDLCSVGYPRLFRDPASGTTYLMHGRRSPDPAHDAIYVYRLEWDRNLLSNGDFARADVEGWQALAGAQLAARRFPEGSPDGTPYLALNCGAPSCDAGAGVHQDVAVHGAGEELAFGGTFRADAGEGSLDLTVHQLDAAGRRIASATVPVSAGGAYAAARGELELLEHSRRLRFQLYPRTPGTLRADNLYLIPQDGCAAPRYPAC